nr:uncharacterized mitochondrial protein AtMg00810-like [Tanacetum cinerariifolium]
MGMLGSVWKGLGEVHVYEGVPGEEKAIVPFWRENQVEVVRHRVKFGTCTQMVLDLSPCNLTNDRDDLGKMKPKAGIGIFIGYSESSRGFRIYNLRTKKIMETIHAKFDELTAMAIECNNLKPGTNCMNFQYSSEDSQSVPSKKDLDNLFGPLYEEYYTSISHEVSGNSAENTLDNENTFSSSSIIIKEDEAPQIACPTKKHLKEVNRIFRYLRQTINMGLWYSKDSGFKLIAYSDADHAGCNDDCKSTYGGIQFLKDKLVSWSSKKQDCTVMSTAEAEYVSLSAYFVVLDFIADPRVPFILGRPFLSTAHAIINVHEREIILRQDQQSLTIQCGGTPSIKKFKQINKIDFINAGESDSEKIENFLNDDLISIGIENSEFNMEKDILFLKGLLIEDPSPPHPIIPNQIKSPIEELKHSFRMGYEHFRNNLVTNDVAESSTKNLIPIPRESKVTSGNRSESIEPIKDDFLVVTIFLNPLLDNDKINSDELNLHVESNKVESTSNHDTVKFDNLEFSGPLIPIYIAEEERIRREHVDYIDRMEMLFTINPRSRPLMNANTNVESIPSLPIPVQNSDSQREEIDIITSTDDVLPLGVENDDSDGEVDAVDDLRVDNSISNFKHEFSKSEESDFDNPSVPLPPPEPPDEEFDFEINFGDEISIVRNTIVEIECIDAKVKFDVSNNENDDLSYFMFVIFNKMFSLLYAKSEDTIFDPDISV